MEWKNWSNFPFTQHELLPSKPGIYGVWDTEELVWYVGRSLKKTIQLNE
ncbi:hypothetical protein IQ264_29755 [Phormidium sp. LEGE 05292]|nr:hypothetical protein [Phormidium sp. LEGE 05292]MBE9229596.1 hypothetical protein [Phormidium sp. LEGE 05292]